MSASETRALTVWRWLRAQVTRRPRRIGSRWCLWTRDQYNHHDHRFGAT